MKTYLNILFLTTIIIISCKNNGADDATAPKILNCEGLITDTAGTNSNAKIYIPSAFTPNGDGKNDIIKPVTSNITSLTFTLYDFLNNVLFTTNQLNQGWGGNAIVPNSYATYYYKIQATTSTNKKIGICGELYQLSCYPSSIPKANIFFEDQLRSNGFTGVTTEVLGNCP